MSSSQPDWANSANHCEWNRVTCDASGYNVIGLDLSNLGLNGSYPESMYKLSKLTTLNTAGNFLVGTVPNSICTMENIQITGDQANCPAECCVVTL